MNDSADSAPSSTFSESAFRSVLGHFPTGVTIVTAFDPSGQPVGLTINSFNSVSLTPPLVLWSLGEKSRLMALFRQSPRYAIHILSTDQRALAERFASRAHDRFEGVEFERSPLGNPVLPGCLAYLECSNHNLHAEGDHTIFIGRVLHCEEAGPPVAAALVFHRSSFFTVSS
jgi:flavin reductase (DIM6/NTAB) family NADH-FMN oxidoreductase RutF